MTWTKTTSRSDQGCFLARNLKPLMNNTRDYDFPHRGWAVCSTVFARVYLNGHLRAVPLGCP